MLQEFKIFFIKLLNKFLESLKIYLDSSLSCLLELNHKHILSHFFAAENLCVLTKLHEIAYTHQFALTLDVIEGGSHPQAGLLEAVEVEELD